MGSDGADLPWTTVFDSPWSYRETETVGGWSISTASDRDSDDSAETDAWSSDGPALWEEPLSFSASESDTDSTWSERTDGQEPTAEVLDVMAIGEVALGLDATEGLSVPVSASTREAGWQGGALPASISATLSAEHAMGLTGTGFAPSDGLLTAPLHYQERESQRAPERAFLGPPSAIPVTRERVEMRAPPHSISSPASLTGVATCHLCATKTCSPPQYQLPRQQEGQRERLAERETGGRVGVGEERPQPSKPFLQAHCTSPGSQAQSETKAAQRQAECPFCKSEAEQETEIDRRTRMRRKRDMPRKRQRFGRWWRAAGYDGPPYCQRCSEVFRDHLMRQAPNSAQCSRENPCDDCARVLPSFRRTTDEELWARFDERNTKNKEKLEQNAPKKRSLPPTVDFAGAQGMHEVTLLAQPQPQVRPVYQMISQVQVQMPSGKRRCTSGLTSRAAVFTGLGLLSLLAVAGLEYQYGSGRARVAANFHGAPLNPGIPHPVSDKDPIGLFSAFFRGPGIPPPGASHPLPARPASVSAPGSWGQVVALGSPTAGLPVARQSAATWEARGGLWIYGGLGDTPSLDHETGAYAPSEADGGGYRSDMWRATPVYNVGLQREELFFSKVEYNVSAEPNVASVWPLARAGCATWTDTSHRLVMFGGFRMMQFGMSDLWRFDPRFTRWEKLGGSSEPGGLPTRANLLQLQAAAADCSWPMPRGHASVAMLPDGTGGFLFGGAVQLAEDGIGGAEVALSMPKAVLAGAPMSDLWFIDADAIAMAKPSSDVYPSKIFRFLGPTSRNYLNDAGATDLNTDTHREREKRGLWPSARSGHSSWIDPGGDSLGRLYIFGGIGVSPHGDTQSDCEWKDDLWRYDPKLTLYPPNAAIAEWQLLSAAHPQAVTPAFDTVCHAAYLTQRPWGSKPALHTVAKSGYQTPGLADAASPSARAYASSWSTIGDVTPGHLWLFGGEYFGATPGAVPTLNDLWRLDINDTAAVPAVWTRMQPDNHTEHIAAPRPRSKASAVPVPTGQGGGATILLFGSSWAAGEETGREDVGVGLDASRVWAMAMASGYI